MGKDNIYNSPTTQISMETWFYNNDLFPTPYMRFISKGNDYSLGIRYDYTGYHLIATVNSQDMKPAQSITINFEPKHKWVHLGFTYNSVSGEYKYYLNGELYFTGYKPAGPVNNGSDSLRIGNKHKGWIDEVRISDYVKSESEIKDNAFHSIDRTNVVNPAAKNLNYSLDGYSVDNLGHGGTTLFFRGNARFSAPSALDNIPVSPINRHDASDYYNTFIMSGYLGVRIPDAGFGGTTVSAIQVTAQPKAVINDVNVFVALNHEKEQDLKMYLISPDGDTLIIYNGTAQLGTNDNIITIFDDEADSSLSTNKFTSFGPVIKPHKPVSSYLNGKSPAGEWKLLVKDNGNAADIGTLYNWGLQFNNGTPISKPVGDNNGNNSPYEFSLGQNYPNPFNPVTNINFTIPFKGMVNLVVYDITGREVKKLVNEEKNAGKFSITFDASGLSSGTYFYKLTTGSFEDVKKMILVK
jgi:subtilisin-like proprotein convertase family protein